MSDLPCRIIRTTLVARVLDTGEVPSLLEGHVATCLRCQAVVVHSTRLRRALADLHPAVPAPEPRRATSSLPWAAAASLAAALVVFRLRSQSA